ncbi:hypothetical protein VNO80_03952 [Phaseolus coccineus]|uniref:Uncharacterized protein n=1 Tax=Phaseolus coccineus TaxID=3886 RepID=A0AAN9NSK8_PHACN
MFFSMPFRWEVLVVCNVSCLDCGGILIRRGVESKKWFSLDINQKGCIYDKTCFKSGFSITRSKMFSNSIQFLLLLSIVSSRRPLTA